MSRGTPEARKRAQAARDERARAAGFANYGAQYRAEHPDKVNAAKRKRTARAEGTNPRAKRMNPRAKATNPSAGFHSDAARVERQKRQARARHYVTTGERWCSTCEDSGYVYDDANNAHPCPEHRVMTAADAYLILHPDPDD